MGRGPVRCWPAASRPREKMLGAGAPALSDAELLAALLGSGAPRQDVVSLAGALLDHFGSLSALLDSAPARLAEFRGIGPAKLAKVSAVRQLVERALREQLRLDNVLASPGAVRDYLRLTLGRRSHEIFSCLYLDSRHRLICAEEASRGTLTQTAVYPREIAREALQRNAAAVIVAHNHPSGESGASEADHRLTQRLRAALDLLDVRLLDHFIVTRDRIVSFAERGWL